MPRERFFDETIRFGELSMNSANLFDSANLSDSATGSASGTASGAANIPNLCGDSDAQSWRHLALEEIDSTNLEAVKLAMEGDQGRIWVSAQRQSRGRARRGRKWVSEKGNLYASLLLIEPAQAGCLAHLPLVAAIALQEALESVLEAKKFEIKWPNDILCAGKKIAGMLLESGKDEKGRQWVVIGCGVNCRHFPEDADYPTTSLAHEIGAHEGGAHEMGEREGRAQAEGANERGEIEPLKLLEILARKMNLRLEEWNRGAGFALSRRRWLEKAKGIGEKIIVRLEKENLEGIFENMDKDGRLVLVGADGAKRKISAGDVFFDIEGA